MKYYLLIEWAEGQLLHQNFMCYPTYKQAKIAAVGQSQQSQVLTVKILHCKRVESFDVGGRVG